MINKYLGITLISASLAFAGCSSNDDDDGGPVTGEGSEPTDPGTTPVDPGTPTEPVDPGTPAGGTVEVPQEYTPNDGVTLSLAETFANRGNFTQLLAAVEAGGLSEALAGPGPLTLFAPTDEVFNALPEGALPADPTELSTLLQGHVISGALDGALVAASVGSSVTAVNTDALAITSDADGNLLIGGVQIVETDIQATNGIIHIITGVIGASAGGEEPPVEEPGAPVPPVGGDDGLNLGPALNAVNSAGFSDYVTLHDAGGLGTSYDTNPWTAFIPNNASIPDAALTLDQAGAFDILNNHIITTGVIAFGDLSALGDTTTNSGLAVTFGGTAAAPTVNGPAITEISSPGTAALYGIDGILQ